MLKFTNLRKTLSVENGLYRFIQGRYSSLMPNGLQRRHFGVEFEICKYDGFGAGSIFDDIGGTDAMYTLGQTIDAVPETFLELHDDGSLEGSSFELVTAPMTMNALNALDWPAMFDLLKELEYVVYDFNKYSASGIHVHVNKKSLQYPLQAACNAELFIASNFDRIRRFSRRSTSQFAHWSALHPISRNLSLSTLLDKASTGDYTLFHDGSFRSWRASGHSMTGGVCLQDSRYRAINFCNPHTYELRIFNSTLRAEEMEAILDFTELLWDMADKPAYDMSMKAFLSEANRRRMPNLVYQLCNPYTGEDINTPITEDDEDDF